MELTGSADLGQQMMEGMLAQFRQTPGVSEEFIDVFLEVANPDDVVDLVVPLYVEALDRETLEATVEFYKTPAGRKLIAAQPMLVQQSMTVGQQWGTKVAGEAQRVLDERHREAESKK